LYHFLVEICSSKHHNHYYDHYPIGREWAAATTQGLQIFSLDESMQFAPTDLDISITPQSVSAAITRQEYGLAVNMSLHLGEKAVVKKAVDAVLEEGIDLVVMSLDVRMLKVTSSPLIQHLPFNPNSNPNTHPPNPNPNTHPPNPNPNPLTLTPIPYPSEY
jgi:hypothetical protein